jgi:hypothetical protein
MYLLLPLLLWCIGTIPFSGVNSEVVNPYGMTAEQTHNSWYQFQNVLWNNEEYRELLNKKKTSYPKPMTGGAAAVPAPQLNDSRSFFPESPFGTIFTGYTTPLRI